MEQGWGVSLEIGEIARRLRRDGIYVAVGALHIDDTFDWLGVRRVEPTAEEVRMFAYDCGADVIVAQTSPYFERLPELADEFEVWAWENGDPSPFLFTADQQERSRIIRHKRETVYPRAARVIAISDFIKHDIGWAPAQVIRLGGDHMPERPPKSIEELGDPASGTIRLGTLMRLGAGEAHYKGNTLFLQLVDHLHERGVPVEAHVAGRGTEQDALAFAARGIVPHLNLTHAEKVEYLRGLDLFVSMSLWEGFNLPLVEAQALGTLSLALDVGSHPEVCPYLISTPLDTERYVARAVVDRHWLRDASALCARFVRSRYSWEATTSQVAAMLRVPDRGRVTAPARWQP
jgi:glycosyltransferase involved in cell wall biosynthesis